MPLACLCTVTAAEEAKFEVDPLNVKESSTEEDRVKAGSEKAEADPS